MHEHDIEAALKAMSGLIPCEEWENKHEMVYRMFEAAFRAYHKEQERRVYVDYGKPGDDKTCKVTIDRLPNGTLKVVDIEEIEPEAELRHTCQGCQYETVPFEQGPCVGCQVRLHWQPCEPEKKPKPAHDWKVEAGCEIDEGGHVLFVLDDEALVVWPDSIYHSLRKPIMRETKLLTVTKPAIPGVGDCIKTPEGLEIISAISPAHNFYHTVSRNAVRCRTWQREQFTIICKEAKP